MKKKKIKKEEKPIKAKNKNLMRNIKARILDKFKPQQTYLIEMNYANGTISHFPVLSKHQKFKLGANTYIIDEDRKVYVNSSKIYMLRYHEHFTMPYDVEVNSQDMRKHASSNSPQIATSFNPSVLTEVLKGEYVKGVIQSAEGNNTKQLLMLILLAIIISAAHFLLNASKSGWF